MEKYIDIFKKIWSHKKYQAIIKLCLYFIFIAIVIVYINSNNKKISEYQKKQVNTTPLSLLSKQNNYEYNIEVYENDVLVVDISGIRKESKDKITINDTQFYLNNSIMYNENLEQIEELPISVIDFYPENIYKMIQNKEYFDKRKYKDGKTETEYVIDETTKILTIENKENIYEIIIYNEKEDFNTEKRIIFKNINNIEDFYIKGLE